MDQLWKWVLISAALLAAAELLWLDRRRRTFFSAAPPTVSRCAARMAQWLAAARRAATGALLAAPTPRREPEHVIHEMLASMSTRALSTRRPAPPQRAPVAVVAAGPAEEPLPPPSGFKPDAADRLAGSRAAAPDSGDLPDLPATIDLAVARGSDGEVGIVYVDLNGKCTSATQVARDLLGWQSGDLALREVLVGGAAQSADLLGLVARQEVIDQQITVLTGGLRQQLEISALALRDRSGNMWGAALFLRRPAAVGAA